MVNIETVKEEYQNLLGRLGDPDLGSNWRKFEELLKKKANLEKILNQYKELQELKNKVEENKTIIAAREEPELITLAETEIIQLRDKIELLEKELTQLIQNKESFKDEARGETEAAIVEIRAGAGGEEAALFASDLFRMYSKYAQSQNFKLRILDAKPTEIGGFKEIIFEIAGREAFSKIKQEAGVHRVQRIPKTEKSGRVHTSTVSVAVLPKPQKGKFQINSSDIKFDTHKSSGPGGQYVNKRMTAVRLTHVPTGLVVTSQTERSLQQNKQNALSILEARLLERQEVQERQKISGQRRAQIQGAKRAEKIRTYNFPQDRITDHRLKKSWRNLEKILEGNLDKIIEALQPEKK